MANLQSTRRQMALSHGTASGCRTTIHVSRHWRSQDMQSDLATPERIHSLFIILN